MPKARKAAKTNARARKPHVSVGVADQIVSRSARAIAYATRWGKEESDFETREVKTAREVAPAPAVTTGVGAEDILGVEADQGQDGPTHVHVIVCEPGKEPLQQGTVFLGITLGTKTWDGKGSYAELDGCIRPEQLDGLVSCLTLARDEATKLGLLREGHGS